MVGTLLEVQGEALKPLRLNAATFRKRMSEIVVEPAGA